MNLRQWIKYILRRDSTFHGEFDLMRRLAGPDVARVFVDVGANDGFYASNSFPFVERGWRCLLIEPHPTAFERLLRRHAGKRNVTCRQVACGATSGTLRLWTGANLDTTHATFAPEVHESEGRAWRRDSVEVDVVPLDLLLVEAGFSPPLGIVSIDTEGWDLEVLRGLDLARWQPRVIVTEDTEHGLAEKEQHLRAAGYDHAAKIDVNSFWVPHSPPDP